MCRKGEIRNRRLSLQWAPLSPSVKVFGKPHIVVQAHLDKLSKVAPVAEDDAFSTVINNIVWTFQDLGYLDDLKAASNVKSAIEKLPSPMILKWNKHLIRNKIVRPTLISLGDWLQEQSEAYELLPMKPKPKFAGKAGADRQRRRRDDPLPTRTPPTKMNSQQRLACLKMAIIQFLHARSSQHLLPTNEPKLSKRRTFAFVA